MCGILAAFGLTGSPEENKQEVLKLTKLLRHRGPDSNSMFANKSGDVFICHERLQIVDVSDAGRWELLSTVVASFAELLPCWQLLVCNSPKRLLLWLCCVGSLSLSRDRKVTSSGRRELLHQLGKASVDCIQ